VTATADLYDERGEDLASLSTQMRSFGAHAVFDGVIRTVRCYEDNALVRQALSSPGAGAVLVIDGGGSLQRALIGDVIAGLAVENGWAGIVAFGAIRDSVAVDRLPIGVKALGTNPRKSAKEGAGEVEVPVEFGGVTFTPGAHIWSDADGILVERPVA
jgi:regulator of ribonuclease activity A